MPELIMKWMFGHKTGHVTNGYEALSDSTFTYRSMGGNLDKLKMFYSAIGYLPWSAIQVLPSANQIAIRYQSDFASSSQETNRQILSESS